MERSNVVGILDAPMRAGHVAGSVGEERSYALRLTGAGRDLASHATAALEAWMLQGLTGVEAAGFRRAMALIESRAAR